MSPMPSQRTRQLSGRAKSRYVRALFESSGASPEAAADADAQIVLVQVRVKAAAPAGAPGAGRRRRSLRSTAGSPTEAAPATRAADKLAPEPPAPEAPAAQPRTPAPEPFNPYAFSAMAVLLTEGRPALEARLELATSRDQIVQLAQAQSVRLEPALLAARKTSLQLLRAAFVDAIEKRIAHRRAVSG